MFFVLFGSLTGEGEIVVWKDEQVPRKFSDYVAALRGTTSALSWCWQELTDEKGKRSLIWMGVAWIIAMLVFTLQPLALGWLVNNLDDRFVQTVFAAGAALLALGVMHEGSSYAMRILREHVQAKNAARIHDRVNELFFEKTLGQHIDESSAFNHANLERARNRVFEVQNIFIFQFGGPICMLAISVVLLWFISVIAGVALTALLFVYVLWAMYLNYHMARVTTPIERAFRAEHRQFVERWEKIVRVKTSGKTRSEQHRLSGWLGRILKEDLVFWIWFTNQSALRDLMSFLVRVGITAYGVYLVYIGDERIGFLVPLYSWVSYISQNLWQIGTMERELSEKVPHIISLRDVLTTPPHFDEYAGEVLTKDTPVAVRFSGVGLSYGNETDTSLPILENVSFSINPGEKVALIGPSGAGKTTIMKLLLRFMDPTEGEIWVNGHCLRDMQLASWMEHVGYIPQQPQVFDGTLRYNLTFGLSKDRQESITDEEIWELMRLLKIDFGERLMDELNTLVGRDGLKLSGGQAQRLMIGAAAIKKPIFMVIDEATSSLDSSTERVVQNGLQQVLAGPTGALIVAHRLSTVRTICNRFLVLRPLEMVSKGENQIEADAHSFEELYRVSPTFRQLADDQGIPI